jgi:hypothetical protein
MSIKAMHIPQFTANYLIILHISTTEEKPSAAIKKRAFRLSFSYPLISLIRASNTGRLFWIIS